MDNMKGKKIGLVGLLVNLVVVAGDEFAVLVAGSNGFWNYRHQADVCHAYQVLKNHGFNPANIILFSYDDVPSDPLNPFPGQLFNRPGTSPDVNFGCEKDYTGSAVNVNNFLAVLTGNSTALKGGNGKVLKSTATDNVFIYFVDHGANGLLAFPTTYLYADQLIAAMSYMSEQKMFQKLVFYLEACESGSMFAGLLPNNTSIYVATSANTSEASWGTYCPPDDRVQGTELYTCLGDTFSVSWMQDSDTADFSVETLQEQYEIVKALTNESHASQYGDLSFLGDTLSMYQGDGTQSVSDADGQDTVTWNSRYIKVQFLSTLAEALPTQENLQALQAEVDYRTQTQNNFGDFASLLSPNNPDSLLSAELPVSDFQCLRAAVASYESRCMALGEFGMGFVQTLVNACYQFTPAEIDGALTQVCPQVVVSY